uniref:Uncharacterized protein n=1 Tax=Chromera velia CCMP2878 TaxID=1169474 RepID=A0A0G4GHI1_9ALVE|eukprot:Cvel_657.t1-p1 / transcript=Cvel_657.t1 / gene=Cvel_657 / organism=Chromera_velia_CCMP2878 / gene_product=hypothetical protein / transcript_product=hypothetical protein / location=Cvel_scaffold20:98666-99259(+) / protein_length=198 / sequence_SO=supercontig / SO=protein_coding / is_pseudo=false
MHHMVSYLDSMDFPNSTIPVAYTAAQAAQDGNGDSNSESALSMIPPATNFLILKEPDQDSDVTEEEEDEERERASEELEHDRIEQPREEVDNNRDPEDTDITEYEPEDDNPDNLSGKREPQGGTSEHHDDDISEAFFRLSEEPQERRQLARDEYEWPIQGRTAHLPLKPLRPLRTGHSWTGTSWRRLWRRIWTNSSHR